MLAQNRSEVGVYGVDGIEIDISETVLNTWEKFKQTGWLNLEACGVLIGGYKDDLTKIVIEECTIPKRKDLRKRGFFKLQDPGHQKLIDKAHADSEGKRFYLGTWHTHPEKVPEPSSLDLQDWEACIARNPDTELFAFAIIGTEQTKIFTFKQFDDEIYEGDT